MTSPECWGLFSEHVRDQHERLFTDAYMAQHPDGDDPRQLQSVSSHLIALHLVLEQGQPRSKTAAILVAAIEVGKSMGGFPILVRPKTWPSRPDEVIEGKVEGTTYARDVLRCWHETESKRLTTWADATLEHLYRS